MLYFTLKKVKNDNLFIIPVYWLWSRWEGRNFVNYRVNKCKLSRRSINASIHSLTPSQRTWENVYKWDSEGSVKTSHLRPVLTLKHRVCYTGHLALVNTERTCSLKRRLMFLFTWWLKANVSKNQIYLGVNSSSISCGLSDLGQVPWPNFIFPSIQ